SPRRAAQRRAPVPAVAPLPHALQRPCVSRRASARGGPRAHVAHRAAEVHRAYPQACPAPPALLAGDSDGRLHALTHHTPGSSVGGLGRPTVGTAARTTRGTRR